MRGLIVKCAGALSRGSGKNCDTLLPICVHQSPPPSTIRRKAGVRKKQSIRGGLLAFDDRGFEGEWTLFLESGRTRAGRRPREGIPLQGKPWREGVLYASDPDFLKRILFPRFEMKGVKMPLLGLRNFSIFFSKLALTIWICPSMSYQLCPWHLVLVFLQSSTTDCSRDLHRGKKC